MATPLPHIPGVMLRIRHHADGSVRVMWWQWSSAIGKAIGSCLILPLLGLLLWMIGLFLHDVVMRPETVFHKHEWLAILLGSLIILVHIGVWSLMAWYCLRDLLPLTLVRRSSGDLKVHQWPWFPRCFPAGHVRGWVIQASSGSGKGGPWAKSTASLLLTDQSSSWPRFRGLLTLSGRQREVVRKDLTNILFHIGTELGIPDVGQTTE